MIPDNPGPAMTISNVDKNTTVTTQHKTIYDSHKILNRYKAPAGYVLGQSFFKPKQLIEIKKHAVRSFTSKCSYNQNMADAIRYGPGFYRGAAFTSLVDIQALAWAQHQSGWGAPILEGTLPVIGHVKSCWIPSLRKYFANTDLTVSCSYSRVYPLQRAHDACIMELVVHSNMFQPPEIKKINYYRLYLNITTVSDISLTDDRNLDPHMRSGNHSLYNSTSKMLPTKQNQLNAHSWKL
eukprot:8167137-Ditylum_brightwellii.AAC.1